MTGLGIEVVAQPLLAFGGGLDDAARGKNTIFDRKASYNRAFEEKSARHILFVYALALAIDDIRAELKQLNRDKKIIKSQEKQLRIARNVRFKYFFMAVVSDCLEELVGRKVNASQVSFTNDASNSKNFTLAELTLKWFPVAKALFVLMSAVMGEDPVETLADGGNVKMLAEKIGGMALATNLANTPDVQEFSKLLS